MSSRGLAAAREQGFADLLGRVETGVTNAADALARLQQPDGHWAFELEADATIPAEYILLRHFWAAGRPCRGQDRPLPRSIQASMAAGRCSTAATSTCRPA
jgi:hypothetical protein